MTCVFPSLPYFKSHSSLRDPAFTYNKCIGEAKWFCKHLYSWLDMRRHISHVIDDLAMTISLCLVMDTCCHALDVGNAQHLPRCYRNTTSWMLLTVRGRAPHIHHLVCNHISIGAFCIPYGYHMTSWNQEAVLGLFMVEDIWSKVRAFYSMLCVQIPFLCKRLDLTFRFDV